MDDVDVKKALSFEKNLREYVKAKFAPLVESIAKASNLSESDEKALHAAVAEFKKNGTY